MRRSDKILLKLSEMKKNPFLNCQSTAEKKKSVKCNKSAFLFL